MSQICVAQKVLDQPFFNLVAHVFQLNNLCFYYLSRFFKRVDAHEYKIPLLCVEYLRIEPYFAEEFLEELHKDAPLYHHSPHSRSFEAMRSSFAIPFTKIHISSPFDLYPTMRRSTFAELLSSQGKLALAWTRDDA